MIPLPRPCLECGTLTRNGSRCETCKSAMQARIDAARGPRPQYDYQYRKQAKIIRETAEACWLCGDGPRPNDPFQADHLHPGIPGSPLAAAHRSCNIRRKNKPFEQTHAAP